MPENEWVDSGSCFVLFCFPSTCRKMKTVAAKIGSERVGNHSRKTLKKEWKGLKQVEKWGGTLHVMRAIRNRGKKLPPKINS